MIFPFPAAQFTAKRSSPFTPASIAGLQLWLDASDASTITQSGGTVSQWNDKSGNANNAAQATGSMQPTYVTNSFNGLNSLLFNGTSDLLLIPEISSTQMTVFVTDIANTTASFAGGFISDNNAASYFGYYLNDTMYVQGSDRSSIIAEVPIDALPHQYTLQRAGGNALIERDSSTFLNESVADVLINFTNIYGLPGAYRSGSAGEILVYNTGLNLAEISQVAAYLKAKWGTP
jgi:hypothetical protein